MPDTNMSNGFAYQPFFEESACPMYIIDIRTMDILDANKPAQTLYGYTKEEFTALKLFDIRAAGAESNHALATDIKSGNRDSFHDGGLAKHKRKNGEEFYVHIYSQPAHYRGMMAGLVIVIDENERIESEKRNIKLNHIIEQQKSRLDDLLSSIRNVVWSSKADTFEVLYINDACLDVYGYTPEEMKTGGNLFLQLILPEDRPGFEEKLKTLFEKRNVRHEFRIQHKDGSIRYLMEEVFLKCDADGKPLTINGISIDITAEKEAKLKVTEQHKRLQEIAWLQSHKVRNHVATIMGLIGLVDTTNLDAHNKELLDNIYQTAKALDGVIRDINRNASLE